MCSLFSLMLPSLGNWVTMEEQVIRDSDTIFNFQMTNPQDNFDVSMSFETDRTGGDPLVSKRLTHNASERDRRKKINSLYNLLCSLLPEHDRSKKMTIPATISVANKYIRELREQVKIMSQRKEELLMRALRRGSSSKPMKRTDRLRSVPNISANWLSDTEVTVQVITCREQKSGISDVLGWLENDGLFLVHASSCESHGRIFYNLHFQVDGTYNMDSEGLSERLLSLYEKSKESFA